MTSIAASKVQFHFLQTRPSLKNRVRLKKFLESIFLRENTALAQLSYIFCQDPFLRKINREFLHHDYNTDIVSFDLSESEAITGEIYISVDRVRDNAKAYKVSQQEELHRVIFHGALHLCGYGDKSLAEKQQMRLKEDQYLQLYFGFVPRGTATPW